MAKKIKLTTENIVDVVQYAQQLTKSGFLKGAAISQIAEKFGISENAARKVVTGHETVINLLKEANAGASDSSDSQETLFESSRPTKRAKKKGKKKTEKPEKASQASQAEEAARAAISEQLSIDMLIDNAIEEISDTNDQDIDIDDFDTDEYETHPLEDGTGEKKLKPQKDFRDLHGKSTDEFYGRITISKKVGREYRDLLVNGSVSMTAMRSMVDTFYATQKVRIADENRIRAIRQAYDSMPKDVSPDGRWRDEAGVTEHDIDVSLQVAEVSVEFDRAKEDSMANIITTYAANDPVCQWLMKIQGIGPIWAAALRAILDVRKAHYAGGFHSYAGLNDQNVPWLGPEKVRRMAVEIWEKLGEKPGSCTQEFMEELARKTGRKYSKIVHMATTKRDGRTRELIHVDQPRFDYLLNNIVKVPYNKDLKTLMYKIASRWNKMPSNTKSLYTMVLLDRKSIETERNARGEYHEWARHCLEQKRIQNKALKKTYEDGFLPKGQIHMRAYRVAEKVFLSHVFEAMYIYEYGKYPARYYTLAVLGHQDEIFPEVPYDELFDAYEQRTGRRANRYRPEPDFDREQDNLFNRVESHVKREVSIDEYLSDIRKWNAVSTPVPMSEYGDARNIISDVLNE